MHPTYLQRHGRHGRHGHHGPGWTLLGGEAACPPKDPDGSKPGTNEGFRFKIVFQTCKIDSQMYII